MITASLGSHRFESGPTYHYNGSKAAELVETMFNPGEVTDYVNTLRGVDATQQEIQEVAAAGIVQLALSSSEYTYIKQASGMLLDVCGGEADIVSRDIFKDPNSWHGGYDLRGTLTNTSLDSATILATRKNKPEDTAALIGEEVPVDEGVFVIGLANGGIISAAHTFLQLGEGPHALSFVSFSHHKRKDREPELRPNPETRKEWLKRTAQVRHVVVYDEDHSSGKTLQTAVDYFTVLFEKNVVGIAPVEVERRITYKPLVRWTT